MLKRIHHINLLVRDLDAAVERYTSALGVSEWEYGDLATRGVRTARFRAGESWVVLVQPTHPDEPPGLYLTKHGEGLFLLSFEVESLEQALDTLEEGLKSGPPRAGLEDWQVADLSRESFFGAQLQLVEEK